MSAGSNSLPDLAARIRVEHRAASDKMSEALARLGRAKWLAWVEREFGPPSMKRQLLSGDNYHCRIMPIARPSGWVAYSLIDPRDGAPFYVGKTLNFNLRMIDHCRVSRTPPLHHVPSEPIDARKVAIFDAGLPVISTPFALETEEQAIAIEQAMLGWFPRTLNTQRKSRSNLRWKARMARAMGPGR